MRRGGVDGHVEVELVEDEPLGGPVATGPRPARAAGARVSARARSTVRRWGWAAVVVVLASLGLQAAADRRERADLARYAGVPGVVASLREPVTEQWRVPVTDAVWAAADIVVSADADRRAVVARDVATGDVRWSVPLPDAVVPPVRCPIEAGDPGGPAAVICLARGSLPGESRTEPAVAVSLVAAVSTTDGTIGHVLSVPDLRGSAGVDGDLVLVELTDEGLVVARHDMVRGELVWRTTLAGVVPGADGVALRAEGDLVVVEARTTTVLAAADGREIGRWVSEADPPASWTARVVVRPGEGYGVWTTRWSGRWYGARGVAGPPLEGRPAEPALHDASTPGVLLLRSPDGGTLRAVEVATGEQRWQRPAPTRVFLRLGGRVVVSRGGRMQALDTATGRTVWTVRLREDHRPEVGGVLTDGLRVLVRGRVDGGPGVTAYSLATGDLLWEAPVPGRAPSLAVLGHHAVATGRSRTPGDLRPELIVLG